MTDPAGDYVDYSVTYLEMDSRPDWPRPPTPALSRLALVRAEDPPARWFLHLYDSVGAAYEWTDWHRRPVAELNAFIKDPNVAIFTLMLQGWSAGFFVLDWRKAGVCDLSYFGLTEDAQGRGLGSYLLKTAILTGWDGAASGSGIDKMTVETSTLDHPRALPLYQKVGFRPVAREEKRRRLSGR